MKKVFISFAIEDVRYRDFLVGQSKLEHSPFEFVDMSVKKPWKLDWRNKCRAKIKSCNGVIGLVSKNTLNASGELFELEAAFEEKIPTMLMYIDDNRPVLPKLISGKLVNKWSWNNIKSFIDKL